ncbi:MAG: cytochrome c4 [Gammaproteobacteria bacterium]|nr:cytochrome c4 [Gammaproteobacteria bacterium]
MNTKQFFRVGTIVAVAILARPVAAEGDAAQGEKLGFTCLGCHGIEGYRNAYPSFRVPRLGGQKADYIRAALTAYRAGTRPHPTMQAQASSLSDADIENLVAWIATQGEAADTASADQVAGVQAAQICVTCHGPAGATVQPVPPVLAGQNEDYLVYALTQYKEGKRAGSVMNAFAATLGESDIELLAGFYASQDGVQTLD